MAKRKKYPKLPNGFGSIKYLGKGRRNPYAVHPPTKQFTLDGVPVTPKALCYVDDWMKGFAVLTAYHAGTYTPGMALDLSELPESGNSAVINRILADYAKLTGKPQEAPGKTFSEVYEEFYQYKFERDKSRQYSNSLKFSLRAAFRNCSALHERTFSELRHDDLQEVIDCCPLKYSSLRNMVSLFNQMYAYAEMYELCDKDYSAHVKVHIRNDAEHGEAFTEQELQQLWAHKNNDIVEMILIMCYSGFRITAYKTLEINLRDRYFKGGVKTAAGKDRIVPIHSGIYDLVKHRSRQKRPLLDIPVFQFRTSMYETLESLGIARHTPHDCRHTFSALCERYGVSENDRKRMLGHSFGNDITNQIYGHREVEDLRHEIEKIKICY